MKHKIIHIIVELGFIMMLFYSNLLMGEYVRSGQGFKKGLIWSILDVFTPFNFVIALVAGLVAYLAVEYLRSNVTSRS